MNPNLLAIIIAFYLSKYDKQGLKNLGFKNDAEAFENISRILGVKKNYIKFRRDEFDPIHPWRKGWRRPMDKRIIKSIEALQDLEEGDLREIINGILYNEQYRTSEEVKQITTLFSVDRKEKVAVGKFVLRSPTGKAAEEYFQKHYSENRKPINGKLIDCRDLGVGYDFRIETNQEDFFVEVKGLSEFTGGVLFTNKEWLTAKDHGERYFLCLVSNLNEKVEIDFIQNPFEKFNPKKNIYTSIQISWSVTQNQLAATKWIES